MDRERLMNVDKMHLYAGGQVNDPINQDDNDYMMISSNQKQTSIVKKFKESFISNKKNLINLQQNQIKSDQGSALNSKSSDTKLADPSNAINPRNGNGAYFDQQSRQPLLVASDTDSQIKSSQENFGCWYQLKRCLGYTVSKEKRRIYLSGITFPQTYPSNKLNNQKYNLFNFLPILLYNEFKFFFNLFFLLTTLSQFVAFLKVGLLVTYVAPLVFVLIVTMLKEAVDDIQRLIRDKDMNMAKFEKASKVSSKHLSGYQSICAQDIRVGHIIKVKHNQRVPADLLLLYTTESSGSIFLRTDQLDGETDWKHRKAVPKTQNIKNTNDLVDLNDYVVALPPNEEIYDFKGYYQDVSLQQNREPLTLENTMWQNTVLASPGYVLGLVLYTGKETRSNMSSKKPRSKNGQLDHEINFLAKILFGVMLLMSLMIVAIDRFAGSWYFKFFRCVLLLCYIIPISMRINLDLAKLYYSYNINNDNAIPGAVARNSNIPEELGRIQFLLSDKTGTLTQNDMIFKRLALEYIQFTETSLDDIRKLLRRGLKKRREISSMQNKESDRSSDEAQSMLDPDAFAHPKDRYVVDRKNLSGKKSSEYIDHEIRSLGGNSNRPFQNKEKRRKKKRGQHQIVSDVVMALILCHNVTPVYSVISNEDIDKKDVENFRNFEKNIQGSGSEQNSDYQKRERQFQASSPDEIALVKFAESLGMELENRTEQLVQIKDANGHQQEYEILENFPFNSDTKRMGIIVKNKENQQIMFYLKGAEVVMEKKVRPDQRVFLTEACERLAQDGLRTLIISQKQLTAEEFEEFQMKYIKARASLYERETQVQQAIETIEDGMDFLAVTGVEDRLQEKVLETIEKFRAAGIQVWMLTGDKIETAKCIAIATGMNKKTERVHEIRGDYLSEYLELKNSIEMFDKSNKLNTMLMIDGVALAKIFSNPELNQRFFEAASGAKSVCVCRCSPTQKAMVARNIRQITGKRIACVGDGGNDVAMIQEADIGIGIVGKEGMQASLASDFSLIQFSHLKELILWHGRMSYQRSAKLSQFIIHRGMIISFCQALFTMIFFSVAIPLFNGYLVLGYATFYTSLPVFSLVLDEDVGRDTCLRYPILYQTLQLGRSLNMKTFLIWVWKSLYQSAVIMFLAVLLFNDSFVMIMSISFTTLIFIELFNVIMEVTEIRSKMIISILASIFIYIGSIFFFNTLFQVNSIFDIQFALKVILIFVASYLPIWSLKKFMDTIDPDAVQKVRKGEMIFQSREQQIRKDPDPDTNYEQMQE